MTVLEALEYGLANIRTYGWIQGELGSRSGGFCALGALPATPVGARYGAAKALIEALPPESNLTGWNDHPYRESAEVEALYLRAIEARA